MSEEKKKIIQRTVEIEEASRGIQAAMAKAKENKAETEQEISAFKKKFPDAMYIQPSARIPTGGIPHPEFEKQRDHLTEYVVGIFESQLVGQVLDFFITGLPGDDYCRWKIPVNKVVGIPRFVAQHINKGLSWKEMKPLGRDNPPQEFYEEEMMIPFSKFETKRRGTFHPINAY